MEAFLETGSFFGHISDFYVFNNQSNVVHEKSFDSGMSKQ